MTYQSNISLLETIDASENVKYELAITVDASVFSPDNLLYADYHAAEQEIDYSTGQTVVQETVVSDIVISITSVATGLEKRYTIGLTMTREVEKPYFTSQMISAIQVAYSADETPETFSIGTISEDVTMRVNVNGLWYDSFDTVSES